METDEAGTGERPETKLELISCNPFLAGIRLDPEKFACGSMATLFFAEHETMGPCVLKIGGQGDTSGTVIRLEAGVLEDIEGLGISPKLYAWGTVRLSGDGMPPILWN